VNLLSQVSGCLSFLRPVVVGGGRGVSCGATMAGRAAAGAGPGRGPPPAVCRCAAVLRRRWPPSPCLGAVRCGLRLVAGVGGSCWCGAASHAARSLAACNRGPPSLTSASTSGLSRPVLPRRLWRVVGLVGFLSDVISGVESALWEGCYPALTLAPTCEANRAS
jgi:hypothetical protein